MWTGPERKVARYNLANLGEAQGGVGKHVTAEKTLLEAHGLLAEGFGAGHERTVKCIEQLVSLYEA